MWVLRAAQFNKHWVREGPFDPPQLVSTRKAKSETFLHLASPSLVKVEGSLKSGLVVSAGGYIFSPQAGDTGDFSQYDFLISVTDETGVPVDGLGQEAFSCLLHLVDEEGSLLGLRRPAISLFENYTLGYYHLITTHTAAQQISPRIVGISVQQFILEQLGPKQIERKLIAQGQVVISVLQEPAFELY